MFVETVRIESLGNTTYVVGSEQSGLAAVIDPVRDVDHYTSIASRRGVSIKYVLETHVHNDFISGARELAAQTGCIVGASASGGLLFDSLRLQEGDELDLGEFKLRVMHTPGHTPEHISFLVVQDGEPTAVFTGGALMPGGAARVDLLGQRLAPFLARWLHHTIHEKLLKLPDDVAVYPTHGGGSFCSASPQAGGSIPSSIASERQQNPFSTYTEEAEFVKFALEGLGSYPAYYKYMADVNRRGPDVLGGVPRLASLTPLSASHQMDEGAILVDARGQYRFNEAHVAGSLSVPYGDNFATWVGWIVPWLTPMIFVSSGGETSDGIVRQLVRIGFDRLNGYIDDDLGNWANAGLTIEATPLTSVEGLGKFQEQVPAGFLVDVRQHSEYRAGHVKGAINIELGELTQHLDGLPREMTLAVLCASGMRATIAGSILQRDGRKNIQVLADSGTEEWLAKGYPSATGDG